jgi:hypothetical protein
MRSPSIPCPPSRPGRRPPLGYRGVQIPAWDGRLFDLDRAAESQTTATRSRASAPRRAWRSPSSPPTSRASSSP